MCANFIYSLITNNLLFVMIEKKIRTIHKTLTSSIIKYLTLDIHTKDHSREMWSDCIMNKAESLYDAPDTGQPVFSSYNLEQSSIKIMIVLCHGGISEPVGMRRAEVRAVACKNLILQNKEHISVLYSQQSHPDGESHS